MKFKSLPSREDILQYYVTENHTKNEALSHFCIGHRKFDELLHQEQAAGETRRMHELGYSRICDAGTRTWVYVKS
jgi:hypothetical protein